MRSPDPTSLPTPRIAEIEAELRRRVLVVPRRPTDFDWLKADAATLDLYGLPPRPDEIAEARAFRLWRELVTTPPQPEEEIVPLYRMTRLLPPYRLRANWFGSHGRQETSHNWSGAVIAAYAGKPFGSIYGKWQVPHVRAPAGAREGDEFACSIWIGLDGYRRTSWSLPQIGTTQMVRIVNGQAVPSMHAWSQWWIRDADTPPLPYGGFVVNAGDVIVCSLEVRTRDRVTLNLANLTTGQSAPPNDMLAPSLSYPLPIRFELRGIAAEWIVERPMKLNSTDLYPLPDFDPVTFDDCVALSAPLVRGLPAARLLRMVDTRPTGGPPKRSAVISLAQKLPPPDSERSIRVAPPR